MVRVGHAENRRLLLRDDDPNRPPPTVTFEDRYILEVGGEVLEPAYHGPNQTPDNIFIHAPVHGGTRAKTAQELSDAVDECLEASALPSHAVGEVLPSKKAPLRMSRRVPVGVVGVIAPFNAPVKLAIRSVAPALGLGNAVILKPDPRTPVSGGVVFARILEEAGLPAGVLHVLPGGADVGSAMVTDANVQAVSFTGSTKAGQSVGELGGRHFARVQLELGGNNALIVMDDVDLDRTVAAAARGSFFNAGQGCMVIGRRLVHESVYDEYVDKLAATADGLTVGNPATDDVDLGPIIDERQRDRIHSLVTGSITAGATLRVGGTYDRLFYRPTVLTGAGPGTPAYDNEIFGPVAPVISFATPGEAIDLASDSEYGLDLSIMTADIGAGLQIALRIPPVPRTSTTRPSRTTRTRHSGGMRHSGNSARFGGTAANIEAYTDTRWITTRSTVPG